MTYLPVPFVGDGLSALSSSLQAGPYGILSLTAVVWSVVLPFSVYKKFYAFSVGYGFSVFAVGLALLTVFPSDAKSGILLAKACVFYGARLGSYLLLRERVRKRESPIKNGSISSRVIFSLSVSLFYALLTAPVLYALRKPLVSSISTGGAYLAWLGAILEAIADGQKFVVKQANKDVGDTFVGPTSLAYRISRHPNYLGELLFWTGIFVGGAPSFGKNVAPWVCSGLGLVGIFSIMIPSTTRLEKAQKEKYGGQEKYENWKKQVSGSLLPFVK